MASLAPEEVYEVMRQLFPAQNDFHKCNYKEETRELVHFGVETKLAFLDMMSKHREEILEIDSEELEDEELIGSYTSEFGKAYMEERIKNKFWFAYPALIRIGLELEFGDKYLEFADRRDGM